MTGTDSTIATLLAHQDWVRALARSLVADPSRADDVAQQTMLEAMTRPPRALTNPKGWLARVAKNAARGLGRQEGRRRRREERVAAESVAARAHDTSDDPAEAAQRAAAHKRLVDELFELDEPYHTVVLLRFFDDLEPRQIAERLGRPVNTVRTQLQRGLERMRARLDDEFGDRQAWCAALLPLFSARGAAKATAAAAGAGVPMIVLLGSLTMKWMLPLVGAVLALVLGLEVIGVDWREPVPDSAGRSAATAAANVQRADVAADPKPTREAVATGAESTADVDAPAEGGRLAGQVLTVDGRPLPGIEVVHFDPKLPQLVGNELRWPNMSMTLEPGHLQQLRTIEPARRHFASQFGHDAEFVEQLLLGTATRPRAATDGRGQFEIVGTDEAEYLRIAGTDWILYGYGVLPNDRQVTMIVGPAVHVAGRIVDEHGAGIDDAYVSVGYSIESLPGIAQRFEHSSGYRSFSDSSSADGTFDLGTVPAHALLRVTAQKRGHVTLSTPADEVVPPVTWTLRAAPASERTIVSGVVRHADGRPAAEAYVRYGSTGATADANGRFEFEIGGSGFDGPVTAHLVGFQPAVMDGLAPRLRADRAAGRDLTLTLGGEPLTIRGRALGPDGEPLANANVYLDDGTTWGTFTGSLEAWLDGRQRGGEWLTGADGSFEIGSLLPREYSLRIVEPTSLLVIESGPIAAGSTDVVLRAPVDAILPELSGVVVDRFGQPVEGVRVAVTATTERGPSSSTFISLPRAGNTDAAGRWRVTDCPQRGVRLWLTGPGIVDGTHDVPAPGGDGRIVVARQGKFRLVGAFPAGVTQLQVVDAAGQAIVTTVHRPDVISSFRRLAVRPGGSPVYQVPDTAVELQLLNDDDEVVHRVPLQLRYDDVNDIAL